MSNRFRLLGFLPLFFFLLHLRYHLQHHTPANMLWICNFSNLSLAAGLFLNLPDLIRIAAIWAIPALPLWLVDMYYTGDYAFSTFLSHLGGLMVSLLAIRKVRAHRLTWIYALLYAIALQAICRCLTPPALNVNVAFRPYYGWERTFPEYWQYWLVTAAEAALGLWLINQFFLRRFPPDRRFTM